MTADTDVMRQRVKAAMVDTAEAMGEDRASVAAWLTAHDYRGLPSDAYLCPVSLAISDAVVAALPPGMQTRVTVSAVCIQACFRERDVPDDWLRVAVQPTVAQRTFIHGLDAGEYPNLVADDVDPDVDPAADIMDDPQEATGMELTP